MDLLAAIVHVTKTRVFALIFKFITPHLVSKVNVNWPSLDSRFLRLVFSTQSKSRGNSEKLLEVYMRVGSLEGIFQM
jgi:hypothetical protein